MLKITGIIIFLIYCVGLTGLEWAAAIIGSRYRRRSWAPAYQLLVVLSWVTVVVEMIGFSLFILHIPSYWMYNVWAIVETGTIFYIQFLTAVNGWAKRALMGLLLILPVGSVICYIVWPVYVKENMPLMLFTLFVQLIGTCAVLIDILQNMSDKLLSEQPAFWLNTGILFYVCIFTLDHILGIYSAESASRYFVFFSLAANTFMYGGFIACFRTLRRQDRKVLDT